jgi:hypothetical protein
MKLKHLFLTAAIFLITLTFVNAQPVKTNGKLSVKGTLSGKRKRRGNCVARR